MGRIAVVVLVVLGLGWFMFGRGSDAEAVTDCLADAGATVEESTRFAQLFPYAISARTLERVEEYPELDGAKFYSVRYGSDRAILFVGKGDDASTAFESTLAGLVSREGQTMSSRRSGRALLVWERPTYAPAIDGCLG